MHIHAGTVMGGTIESSGPHIPLSRSFVKLGMSPAYSSNTCCGGAQSRPMTMTLRSRFGVAVSRFPFSLLSSFMKTPLGLIARGVDEDARDLGTRKLAGGFP